jgi:hypothetical protein
MRIRLFVTLAAIGLALMLAAQTTDRFSATSFDMNPVLLPSTTTNVFTTTVFVDEITLSNSSSSAVTVTVSDRQSSPMPLLPAVSVPANSVVVAALKSRKFPNGLSWSASTPGVVVGYVAGRR